MRQKAIGEALWSVCLITMSIWGSWHTNFIQTRRGSSRGQPAATVQVEEKTNRYMTISNLILCVVGSSRNFPPAPLPVHQRQQYTEHTAWHSCCHLSIIILRVYCLLSVKWIGGAWEKFLLLYFFIFFYYWAPSVPLRRIAAGIDMFCPSNDLLHSLLFAAYHQREEEKKHMCREIGRWQKSSGFCEKNIKM